MYSLIDYLLACSVPAVKCTNVPFVIYRLTGVRSFTWRAMERRYINALIAIAVGSAILVGLFIFLGPSENVTNPGSAGNDTEPLVR